MASQHPFEQDHSHSLLQSIVETAIDGIFLINSEGIIMMCNAAAGKLFGYEAHDLVGQDIRILMPSPHRELHHAYVHNYLHTGIKKIIGIGREVEAVKKDGTQFPARLAVSEIVMDGHHYFTGIIHDLTNFKAIEHKLLSLNQELEQVVQERTLELQDAINRLLDTNLLLNQSIEKHQAYENALVSTRDELRRSLEKEKELGILKSRFIAMASHEFKTPLSSILSSAALISRYEGIDHVADRKRHVERIKASVTHLNTILTDFLSVTRLEEGKFQPQVTRFMLDGLITDLVSEMEVLLKPGQVLTFEYKTAKLEMESDKNIIRNILYNLLSNAIKYSEENTRIRGKVRSKDKNFIISIRDEGIGIPPEDRKHIGTRFFRSSNVTHLQGTGLGLNIVLSVLHYLKGNLTFKSHKDKGTTFILTLPAKHEE
jgi:PAS domain S-box-containing protein